MMGEKNDPHEDAFLNLLIVSLIIGIIITSGFVYYFRSGRFIEEAHFTEIYFDSPDQLPNMIKIGQDYELTTSIKSHEKTEREYILNSKVELYNLYGYYEERLDCLGAYRAKSHLIWTNNSNFTVFDEGNFEVFQNLVIMPDLSHKINWTRYTLEFGFPPPRGVGRIAIFFANETDLKYKIVLDDYNDEVSINNLSKKIDIDFQLRNNKFKLIARDAKLYLFLDEKMVLVYESNDIYQGQFGFESQDTYFILGKPILYRDIPNPVPDDSTVLRYSINNNLLGQKRGELKHSTNREVRLLTRYSTWNETIDCETDPFYCEYFDIPNDISFYVNERNLTKVVEKVPVVESNMNYRLYPMVMQEAVIGWESFNISTTHRQFQPGSYATIIMKFSDKWAVMITRNNSYYLRQWGAQTRIDEIRNPEKELQDTDTINLTIDDGMISLFIDGDLVFEKTLPDDYTNGTLEVYIKNSFILLQDIHIENNDRICLDPLSYEFCSLTMTTSVARRPATSRESFDTEISYYDTGDYIEEPLEAPGNLSQEVFSEEFFSGEREAERPVIETPVENPFIPDKRIIFNTASSRVTESNDFQLSYWYQPLDGARIFVIGLEDDSGTELVSLHLFELSDRMIVYDRGNLYERYWPINTTRSHTLMLHQTKGDTVFKLDNEEIYRISATNINSGRFFIGTKNTYADIQNVRLQISDRNISRSLDVTESDPCALKLIYRKTNTNRITLSPEEVMTLTKNFRIASDFDYGKVSFELYGSSMMNESEPIEIHAWLVRDDN